MKTIVGLLKKRGMTTVRVAALGLWIVWEPAKNEWELYELRPGSSVRLVESSPSEDTIVRAFEGIIGE